MEYQINIEYSCSATLNDDCEDLIQKITGRIIARSSSSGEEDKQEIGKIELIYIDVVSAEEDDINLFTLFDLEAGMGDYCYPLYDLDEYDWSKRVYESLEDHLTNLNLLIIHRVKLLPKFRGQKIGLLAIRRSIQQFGNGCGLVCLIAKPYQVELSEKDSMNPGDYEKYGLSQFAEDKSTATRQLETYYKKMGFIPLRKRNLMALNLAKIFPSMKQLGASYEGPFQI